MTDSDDQAMTGGELQTVREYLGLTGEDIARLVEVAPRTVRAWEAGTVPIPTARREGRIPVREAIERLEAHTAAAVDDLVSALRDSRDPAVVVYRTDDDMHAERPDTAHLPARWWRHVVARAVEQVHGVEILDFGPVDLFDAIGGEHVARVRTALRRPVTHEGVEYRPLGAHSIGSQPAKSSYVPASVFKGERSGQA